MKHTSIVLWSEKWPFSPSRWRTLRTGKSRREQRGRCPREPRLPRPFPRLLKVHSPPPFRNLQSFILMFSFSTAGWLSEPTRRHWHDGTTDNQGKTTCTTLLFGTPDNQGCKKNYLHRPPACFSQSLLLPRGRRWRRELAFAGTRWRSPSEWHKWHL